MSDYDHHFATYKEAKDWLAKHDAEVAARETADELDRLAHFMYEAVEVDGAVSWPVANAEGRVAWEVSTVHDYLRNRAAAIRERTDR